MSKNLFTVLTLAILFSTISCRVVRDAPNNPDLSVSVIYTDIAEGLKKFQEGIMQFFEVKTPEELQQKAVEKGKDYAAKLDVFANEIKKQSENWNDFPIIQSIQKTVEQTVADFKAKNPQTAEEAASAYESVVKGVEVFVEKVKAIGESEDATKLKDLSKRLLEAASNVVQNTANDVQDSLKKQ